MTLRTLDTDYLVVGAGSMSGHYRTEGTSHLVTSRLSGETVQVNVRRRVVDATHLSPAVPATTPPPFAVADDVEATRDDDREHNRLCPLITLSDNPTNWAEMQARGTIAGAPSAPSPTSLHGSTDAP